MICNGNDDDGVRHVQVTGGHPPVHRRGARQPGHQHHQPAARPAGARGCNNKIHTWAIQYSYLNS